jgi:tetratricopeptide (TPR) repeat protein
MTRLISRSFVIVLLAVVLLATDVFATCGGGGGGGTGGMAGMSSMPAEVYPVPWQPVKLGDPVEKLGLAIYWFPASQTEYEKSSLRNSRTLTLLAKQCVTLGVSDSRTPLGEKFATDEKLPVAVLADADGKIIGKALNKDGFLRVDQVEKLVNTEVKTRENALKATLKEAKEKAKTDKEGAIALYKGVAEQKCLFPNQAKDATNELKKLGITGTEPIPLAPVFDPSKGAQIEQALKDGLMAENMAKYPQAEKLYARARQMDPADPVPLRYLGELYRHQTGDWDKAKAVFEEILAMPADPISRAIALHGIGKMTIHNGEFKKGLGLMEDSVRAYPTPLAYRNLAVYWNSEGDMVKSDYYTQQALALDPKEPFNLIFAAAFMADRPEKRAEALRIAKENEDLLCASYNLAAIYAQTGDKKKALALLKRHFFEYEKYDSVRSKEMMEARVDRVFDSLMKDTEFLALTAMADGKLPMPRR